MLVAVTGAVVGVQMSLGRRIDALETWVAWTVLGLVLVRQIVTLIENTALLERVSATQAELAYRAQHDPLTGLANRALFGERLNDALERHRTSGAPLGLLLVDLDDFKAINDSLGHGRRLTLGASLGLVEPDGDQGGVTADVLMQRADGAMYVGKRQGKGVAVRYRPDLEDELGAASAPSPSPSPGAEHPVPSTWSWPQRISTRR